LETLKNQLLIMSIFKQLNIILDSQFLSVFNVEKYYLKIIKIRVKNVSRFLLRLTSVARS